MYEKSLNVITLNYIEDGDPSHQSTYIFLSSVPVLDTETENLVFKFLSQWILIDGVGELDNYAFSVVCNQLDISMLPDLGLPFVDIQTLRQAD